MSVCNGLNWYTLKSKTPNSQGVLTKRTDAKAEGPHVRASTQTHLPTVHQWLLQPLTSHPPSLFLAFHPDFIHWEAGSDNLKTPVQLSWPRLLRPLATLQLCPVTCHHCTQWRGEESPTGQVSSWALVLPVGASFHNNQKTLGKLLPCWFWNFWTGISGSFYQSFSRLCY